MRATTDSLSRTKPWEAEGISRDYLVWATEEPDNFGGNKDCYARTKLVRSSPIEGVCDCAPTPKPASPDLFNPLNALRYWSPRVPVE
jgi:hypothetical protein